MLSRQLLLACATIAALVAADAGTAAAPPWTDSFNTQIRGKDRQFVQLEGRTFILFEPDEIAQGLGDNQDIAITAKLKRLPGERFGIYRVDGLVIDAPGTVLAGKLDGDNVHLLGSLAVNGSARVLTVSQAASAPSDAALLQAKLEGLASDDWDRRLGVVSWCHDQGRSAGNAEFWIATADTLLSQIVNDQATKAAERHDLNLLTRAFDLALNQLRDPGIGARIASAAWIREVGGSPAEAIARRLRALGYAIYKDQWMPRPQALEQEFEDRFADLNWKDAEGFYRLGRWADENGEALPRARERSWRCYQIGYSADPTHPNICRELGIQLKTATTTDAAGNQQGAAADFVDTETGLSVPAPAGWKHGEPIGSSTVWLDNLSETAYLTVRSVRPPIDPVSLWDLLAGEARAKQGFVETGSEATDADGRRVNLLRYTWTEGSQQLFSSVCLTVLKNDQPAAVIEARGLPSDQPRLDAAVASSSAGTKLIDGDLGPLAKPAPTDKGSSAPGRR